jgi:Fur family iron response transcriptional regulator
LARAAPRGDTTILNDGSEKPWIVPAASTRPTRQRLGLARLLFEDGDRHVTAEQLHAESASAKMRVSLATIYNTLNQFSEVGLLREVVVEPGRSYFDTNTTDHHHFFHEETAQLQDIPGNAITVGPIPEPPSGTSVERVDIIVRVKNADA